jgi:hypothetical protein
MTQSTNYQYVKLGMNLEYLRGLNSVSILLATSLVAFPHLMENLPAQRYSVSKLVEVLRSLLIQLEEMGLTQTLAAAANFRPMLAEMEAYLGQTPNPQSAILQDHFANKLAQVAKQVALVLKQELGSTPALGPRP